jgi:hypothetical protein
VGLKLTSNFTYDPEIGAYDFTQESSSILELRSITKFKEVEVNDTPLTILAYREYGDHNLWWVIAAYNSIIEVDNFPETTLLLPNLEEVRRVLK